MKLKEAITSLGNNEARKIAKGASIALGVKWDTEARFIFSAILKDAERVPGNIGSLKDTTEYSGP